jgi:hypothetical protein
MEALEGGFSCCYVAVNASHLIQLLLSSGVQEVDEGEGSLFAVTVPPPPHRHEAWSVSAGSRW